MHLLEYADCIGARDYLGDDVRLVCLRRNGHTGLREDLLELDDFERFSIQGEEFGLSFCSTCRRERAYSFDSMARRAFLRCVGEYRGERRRRRAVSKCRSLSTLGRVVVVAEHVVFRVFTCFLRTQSPSLNHILYSNIMSEYNEHKERYS